MEEEGRELLSPEIEALHRELLTLKQGLRSTKGLVQKAEALVEEAYRIVASVARDIEAFRSRCEKDEDTFSLALRLKGNEMVARQLLWAADDLREEASVRFNRRA